MFYILGLIIFLAGLLILLSYLGFLYAALAVAYFCIVFCLLFLVAFLAHFYGVIFKGNAPYIRTSKKLIKRLGQEINFPADSLVYELGSGDGRVLRALAKNSSWQVIGYEYFFWPYLLAKIFNWLTQSSAKIYRQDFFKADLSRADVVFCYLITKEMARLEQKLAKELKPGAIVISNTFQLKNWPLQKTIVLDENKKGGLSNKLYFYVKN